jgi:hypothetical protein
VLGVYILHLSTILIFDFVSPPTVRHFFVFHFIFVHFAPNIVKKTFQDVYPNNEATYLTSTRSSHELTIAHLILNGLQIHSDSSNVQRSVNALLFTDDEECILN